MRKKRMDISVIKKLEGKSVNLTVDIGNRCGVYTDVIYKFTSKGTIEFIDKKVNIPCYISSECIKLIEEVGQWD